MDFPSRSPPAELDIDFWVRDVNLASNSTASNSTRSAVYSPGRVVGFTSLASFLLVFAALFSGLTLAICSIDMTWLHVLSISGCEQQRYQAKVVAKIKRHKSWFLCSMIICSVACTESIPKVIEQLGIGSNWQPILISTLAITVFAELLPQYYIPRQALFWGSYCWPLIWSCMWISCVISWPLSILLDIFTGSLRDRGIFTSEQLAILIKYHERSEKHGGGVGSDAGRIARAALDLEGRTLGGQNMRFAEQDNCCPGIDVERAAANMTPIIVPWQRVRYVHINDEVTKEFIQRIKEWAHSRVLVVGKRNEENDELDCQEQGWNGQKLYGFLHVKNLLGIALIGHGHQSEKLFVKDLPLHSLPIVRDDLPIYDLLTLFQMEMSRIAVIIPMSGKNHSVSPVISEKYTTASPRRHSPMWSVINGLNTTYNMKMRAFNGKIDWTTDFLTKSQPNMEIPIHDKCSVMGIGCPEPLGIVTYDDILEVLMRKAAYDEKDFFDRDMPIPNPFPEGDASSVVSIQSVVRKIKGLYGHDQRSHWAAFESPGLNAGSLRRRNASVPLGHDGANDSNDHDSGKTIGYITVRDTLDRSSYTENSHGGFHEDVTSHGFIDDEISVSPGDFSSTAEEATVNSHFNSLAPTRTTSSPARLTRVHSECKEVIPEPELRKLSWSQLTLPRLRRVTPFSHLNIVHEEPTTRGAVNGHHHTGISSSILTLLHQNNEPSAEKNTSRQTGGHCGSSQRTTRKAMPLWSTDNSDADTISSDDYQRSLQEVGSHQSTGADSAKENIILVRKTSLQRPKLGATSRAIPKACIKRRLRERDECFHDDRALLPSQRRLQYVSSTKVNE